MRLMDLGGSRAVIVPNWIRRAALALRIRAKDRAWEAEVAKLMARQPTVRDRQQELVRFYGHYEELVEILCDLATCGPTDPLEARYQSARQWMTVNYPEVRRHVTAYLRYHASDAGHGIELNGQTADGFEALFAPSSLAEFLHHDDGHMIDRIDRTRAALTLYGRHLRILASND